MADEVKSTLVRLNEQVAAQVATAGPTIEGRLVAELASEQIEKRFKIYKTAFDTLRKLKSERNKIKPDVPAILNADGSQMQPAGYTEKTLKASKELGDRIKKLQDDFEAVVAAQSEPEPNAQKVAELYQKLSQTTDKASKGVSGGDSE